MENKEAAQGGHRRLPTHSVPIAFAAGEKEKDGGADGFRICVSCRGIKKLRDSHYPNVSSG